MESQRKASEKVYPSILGKMIVDFYGIFRVLREAYRIERDEVGLKSGRKTVGLVEKRERNRIRVEPLPRKRVRFFRRTVRLFVSVDLVSNDGIPDGREVYADLVRAPGKQVHFEKSVLPFQPPFQYFEFRFGNLRIDGIGHRHSDTAFRLASDERFDIARIFFRSSKRKGQIRFLYSAIMETLVQKRHRAVVFRDDDDTGSILVETVHDARTFHSADYGKLSEVVEERVHEGSGVSSFPHDGMRILKRIFVDDREVGVLVHDIERNVFGFELSLFAFPFDGNDVASVNLLVFIYYLSIHVHVALIDHPLNVRPRPFGILARQKGIYPARFAIGEKEGKFRNRTGERIHGRGRKKRRGGKPLRFRKLVYEGAGVREEFAFFEEAGNFLRGRFFGIGRVDDVVVDVLREVAADGSRKRVSRIGCAAHGANDLNGVVAFDGYRNDRAGHHERSEELVEPLGYVFAVVVVAKCLVHLEHLDAYELETLLFEAVEYGSDNGFLYCVGLEEDEGLLHGKEKKFKTGGLYGKSPSNQDEERRSNLLGNACLRGRCVVVVKLLQEEHREDGEKVRKDRNEEFADILHVQRIRKERGGNSAEHSESEHHYEKEDGNREVVSENVPPFSIRQFQRGFEIFFVEAFVFQCVDNDEGRFRGAVSNENDYEKRSDADNYRNDSVHGQSGNAPERERYDDSDKNENCKRNEKEIREESQVSTKDFLKRFPTEGNEIGNGIGGKSNGIVGSLFIRNDDGDNRTRQNDAYDGGQNRDDGLDDGSQSGGQKARNRDRL